MNGNEEKERTVESENKYDTIVIGFGKGGKTLAAELGAGGERVAVIERSNRMYGGTCINVGCIPTKSLVHSAQLAVHSGAANFEEKAELYRKAVEEKVRLTVMLRNKNYGKLANLPQVDVIDGFGSFLDTHHILVTTPEKKFVLEGEKIFINTGSTAVIPTMKGIESNPRVFFSETLLDLAELPKRLVIIGGGYIGLEFASFYTSFGSEVTVIQDSARFLPREDEDIAEEIKAAFEKRGVTFLLSVDTKEILDRGFEAVIVYEKDGARKELAAEAVLVATGRRANTDGLNLDAAGIRMTPRGAVEVDDQRRTSVPNVWAMGDVAGGLQFTYVSLDDERVVRSQVISGAQPYSAADRKNVPYSVFIEPAFSRVGINEQEAKKQGLDFRIAKLPASAIPKAQVLKETEGLLKAVIETKSGAILGAMLFCAESYEMINLVKLAMDAGLPASVLANQVFTHPTMSEALNDLFA